MESDYVSGTSVGYLVRTPRCRGPSPFFFTPPGNGFMTGGKGVEECLSGIRRRASRASQCKRALVETRKLPQTLTMSSAPKFFKVTQLRSTIGLPKLYKETLQSLGLRRRNQTVYHKISPQQAGQIARVKELVKVELSPVYKDKVQLREERKSEPGFVVVGKRQH